jgi:hypothetical protein
MVSMADERANAVPIADADRTPPCRGGNNVPAHIDATWDSC